ncbi:von Willebrand factor D and EGF domain-containing protein-like [Lingula anatina]|uniref:von Willebrand factor D and EGF domain-containing protein-like n=1 Tax=Lingula anatina TaxID=7574 RepID=A0A2R2MTT6_LINAN|nr:von Willebrand factor D and EGF domain-containing protein-like [Lingula anatina]|eukprot:XP_023933654.1 von Willebrand factor D and EGF domain-containing protein-like [Lingula anatina]
MSQTNTPTLQLREDGQYHNVTYELTLPLVCGQSKDVCSLKFGLRTLESFHKHGDSVGSDIFLSSCVIEFSAELCRLGSCKQTIQVTAGNDGFDDDGRETEIHLDLLEANNLQWKGYETPRVKVTVKDVPTARCYVFGDPHVITFDGRQFDLYKTGTFVLYQSKRRQFEVDVRAWACSETPNRAACACGVVAREGQDTVAVDMCNTVPGSSGQPDIDVKSGTLSRNTKIFKARDGKIVTVAFGSGSFVRIFIEKWGLSLVVQAPSEDWNSTMGLCGTFDGDTRNDFHDRTEQVLETGSEQEKAYEFLERWRLLPGESLFDYQEYKQQTVSTKSERTFCDCSNSRKQSNLNVKENILISKTNCKSKEWAQLPFIMYQKDVTGEYNNSNAYVSARRTRSAELDAYERFRAYVAARRAAQLSKKDDSEFKSVPTLSTTKIPQVQSVQEATTSSTDLYKQAPSSGARLTGTTTSTKILTTSSKPSLVTSTPLPLLQSTTVQMELTTSRRVPSRIVGFTSPSARSRHGYLRNKWVAFGSGSFVRIFIEKWGLSLVVQAPSEDWNSTMGLCGTFDGDTRNDFHDRTEQVLVTGSEQEKAYEFLERWRLLPGESLFDYQEYKQQTVSTKSERTFCDCSNSRKQSNLNVKENILISKTNCKSKEWAQLPFIMYQKDVTAEYNNSNAYVSARRTRSAELDAYERFRAYVAARRAAQLSKKDDSEFKSVPTLSTTKIPQVQSVQEATTSSTDLYKQAPSSGARLTGTTTSTKILTTSSKPSLVTSTPLPLLQSTTVQMELTTSRRVPSRIVGFTSPSARSRHGYLRNKWVNRARVYNIRYPVERTTILPTTREQNVKSRTKENKHPNIKSLSTDTNSEYQKIRNRWRHLHEPVFKRLRPETIERLESRLSEFSDKSSYFFAGDFLDLDTPPLDLKWPTASGITHNRAIFKCSQVILNTSIAKFCGEYLQEKIRDTIDNCVKDIQVKEDYKWTVYSIPLVEALCEEAVWKRRLQLSKSIGFPPPKVLSALNCPRGCSGRGTCGDTGCQCVKGFQGADCTAVADRMHMTLRTFNGGLCDTRASSCSTIQLMSDEPISEEGVKCSMDSVMLVSHEGVELSTPSETIVFDSVCWDCSGFSKTCVKKNNTCNIDGVCFAAGSYHPADRCQQCQPSLSTTTWSLISVNEPPFSTRPRKKFSAIAGEQFNYQIVAADPEGSQLTFFSPYRDLVVTSEGKHCQTRLNACSSSPCVRGRCIATADGYGCICRNGFTGRLCDKEIDICHPNPCYPGVKCTAARGWYVCGPCPEGTVGNGRHCTVAPGCAARPCFPGVTCRDVNTTRGQFECGPCPYGYHGNGITCDPPPRDSTQPAEEKPVCRSCPGNRQCNEDGSCQCTPGYTGSRCHIARCNPSCLNRGFCVRPNVCQCKPGYRGERCEEAICERPCGHNGRCIAPNLCSCPYGYVGPQCEKMICKIPCHNGALCIHPNRCLCRSGYTGRSCLTPVCDPGCQNGGVCVRPNVCSCPHMYFGERCERAHCAPSCLNGGRCLRRNQCACTPGWAGSRCQIPLCEPRCLHGGRCVYANMCSCPTGWEGPGCKQGKFNRELRNFMVLIFQWFLNYTC